ncbi:MAG: hypothetical protein Q9227_007682 [Pyrenula ochraceoflavens]
MPGQSIRALLMIRVAFLDLLQAIADQELVVGRGEDGGGDVDQDRNPGVRVVKGEGFLAEEDGGHDAGAQVTREVCGDGVGGEAPDHDAVGETDGEGDADGGDEGVGGVEAGPDDDADEAVDEEFLEEEVALVGLVGVGEDAEDGGGAAVEDCGAVLGDVGVSKCGDLGPVGAHEDHAGHEGAEDLGEDVVGDFAPGEALPEGETDGDGWVEVTARDGGAGDDGKGDTDSEGHTDGEDVAKGRGGWLYADFGGRVGNGKIKGGHCSNSGEARSRSEFLLQFKGKSTIRADSTYT